MDATVESRALKQLRMASVKVLIIVHVQFKSLSSTYGPVGGPPDPSIPFSLSSIKDEIDDGCKCACTAIHAPNRVNSDPARAPARHSHSASARPRQPDSPTRHTRRAHSGTMDNYYLAPLAFFITLLVSHPALYRIALDHSLLASDGLCIRRTWCAFAPQLLLIATEAPAMPSTLSSARRARNLNAWRHGHGGRLWRGRVKRIYR